MDHMLEDRSPADPAVRPWGARPIGARPRHLLPGLLLAVLLLAAPAAQAEGPEPARPPAYAYQATGGAVTGGASIAQATEIAPGIHRDVLDEGSADAYTEGSARYYRIAVADGERVHAAATLAAPPYPEGIPEEAEPLGVSLSFVTAAGDTCGDRGAADSGEAATGDGPVSTSLVSEAVGPDGCTGDSLFLRVARSGPRAADQALPVEVQVAIQPPGIGGGSPAVDERIEDAGASPVAPEDPEPIEAGRSFAGARAVEPGSVVVELVPGETSVLALDVAEGQRLRWRWETTSAPEDAGQISLLVHDPARSLVTVDGGVDAIGTAGAVAGGGMAAPVDLGNRSSDSDAIASAWLPGRHTVLLHRLQRPAGDEPAGDEPVRLILTLELEGEPAEDAAEGTVLELGDLGGGPGTWGIGRIGLLVGAGLLSLVGLAALGGGTALLLGERRRRAQELQASHSRA